MLFYQKSLLYLTFTGREHPESCWHLGILHQYAQKPIRPIVKIYKIEEIVEIMNTL